MSSPPPRPGWARLAVAAAAVAATLFNLWVSFGPLRDPSRIQGEAMRGFGRESVFYTMHGNVAAAVYAVLAAALAGAEAAGLAPPPPSPGGATAVGGWAAVASVVYGAGAVVLTAVALVVGLGYYVLIHFHPAYAEKRSTGGGRVVGSRSFVSLMVLPLTLLAATWPVVVGVGRDDQTTDAVCRASACLPPCRSLFMSLSSARIHCLPTSATTASASARPPSPTLTSSWGACTSSP